jgi:indolepyruvate ferredoxin oxidoreductase
LRDDISAEDSLIPLQEASLLKAIELSGTAVDMNKAAFGWGRQAALDMATARSAAGLDKSATVVMMPPRTPTLEALLADRMQRLAAYQDAAYAERYGSFVREVARAEMAAVRTDRLAREVGVSLYKLMAYKDEYEVARQYVDSGFFEKIGRQFEGDYRLKFHLAPPLVSRKNARGHLIKKQYGPWIATAFKWLAKAKDLRGTALDVFGYTQERRTERALILEYMQLMRQVVGMLTAASAATALELARLPQTIRGFGHVKEENLAAARIRQAKLLETFDMSIPTVPEREVMLAK